MTFAERTLVGRRMQNMLGQGFVLKHMLDRLQGSPDAVGAEYVEAPIIDFGWRGRGNRKLVANLDVRSVAYRTLCQQALAIDAALDDVRGAGSIEVRMPDHVTVATYGQPGDGMALRRAHRGAVARKFHESFLTDGDGSQLILRLGSLVVGESYHAFDGMELTASLPPVTEPAIDEEIFDLGLAPEFAY